MVYQSKREYLDAIRERYGRAGWAYKRGILDEFCRICGYHRKHAIRLLNTAPRSRRRRPGPKPQYGPEVREVLKVLWLATNRLCSKLLKAAVPIWGPFYEQQTPLNAALRQQLLTISPASIDRLLRPVRRELGAHGLGTTRPGSLLKQQIPIKTSHWENDRLGYVEVDTVAHGGSSTEGDFVWSVTLTDTFSGWTESRAIWNRGYQAVADALRQIEASLPFRLLGFHCDNGGEFLNHHLLRYYLKRDPPICLTRSRPDHKDDNAHVEQKNWTHVRQLLGYSRIDQPELVPHINRLYEGWGLFHNYFCPTLKLAAKTKIGSRYQRRYEPPRTPMARIWDCPYTLEPIRIFFVQRQEALNPFALKRFIDHHQRVILQQLR